MSKSTPFWGNDLSILLNKEMLFELWPTKDLSYEGKMNAIARLVILLSLVGFICTKNINIIAVSALTLLGFYILYATRQRDGFNVSKGGHHSYTKNVCTDGPNCGEDDALPLKKVLKEGFHPVTSKNPMGNVLLTDIADNPNRKSAQPSFNPDVGDDILESVKRQTQELNTGIKNTDKQLFGDLKDNYDLDNAMQRFYTTANTRVENDQGSFAQYLYGNMYSAKEDTPEGAGMRVKDNLRYIIV